VAPKLYWIDSPGKGRIAISARPRGGDWLEDEVKGLQEAGVDVLVSLLTPEEVKDLELEKESSFSRAHGMEFLSLPIADRGTPRSQSEAERFVQNLHNDLAKGRAVAIHCRQGIGRSGMIAAAVLIADGATPNDAVERISKSRGLPIPETFDQLEWEKALPKAATPSNVLHHEKIRSS